MISAHLTKTSMIMILVLTEAFFWIKIKGIKPAELGNVYGVNLVSDEGSVIVETSPYVYVKKALESGDSRLQNLCKAMWAYGQAAREYEK